MSEEQQDGVVPGEAGATDDEASPARPIWHLAESAHWERARAAGRYERSTRAQTLAEVGFIHASYPEQLPGVAKALYDRVAAELVVLEIDPARLELAGVEVRVEPGDPAEAGSQHYPHLYGPLPVPAVTRTRPARVDKGWLELGPWEPC